MHDWYIRKGNLRAAMGAAWWTTLIGFVLLCIWWVAWMLILANPNIMDAFERMMGGAVKAGQVNYLAFIFFNVWRSIVLVLFLLSVFLTFWNYRLQKWMKRHWKECGEHGHHGHEHHMHGSGPEGEPRPPQMET
jgi:hypothetical protein